MTTRIEQLLQGHPVVGHRPWPRLAVAAAGWLTAARELKAGRLVMLGFWGEIDAVHLALQDASTGEIAVATLSCPDGRFPSVAAHHRPADRLERSIHDLFGLVPEGGLDGRPWLDHGRWDVRHPLGANQPAGALPPYVFLPVEGDSLHQIPVGPVHAGIIEPGHFRFTANGEAVVRLEQRLGYVHKGVEGLMTGADLDRAAKLAGRLSGDSTVAYAYAFARAAEAALGIDAPPRAIWLRAAMAELERLANHFGDIGAVCNDASFSLMHAHCGVLRERVLRAADTAFGHRLMRDRIVAGGVSVDLDATGIAALHALLAEIRHRFPELVELYDNTASLQERTTRTGFVSADLVRRYGCGGYIGRASGRDVDARRQPGYPPYDELRFDVPIRNEGDVNARIWVRILEVEQSLSLLDQILVGLPDGPPRAEVPAGSGEGMALIEGFRGDILVWLRLKDGRVVRCHPRDPSWFQWPLLEAAIEGNIVADFPLCNKSFNCSYSGHDL